MLNVFWERYHDNPTISVVESFHIPSFLGTFPGLTVCSMVPPSLAIRRKMLQKLRLPENISRREAANLLRYREFF